MVVCARGVKGRWMLRVRGFVVQGQLSPVRVVYGDPTSPGM